MILRSVGEKLFTKVIMAHAYVLILIIRYKIIAHTFPGNTLHFFLLIIKRVNT